MDYMGLNVRCLRKAVNLFPHSHTQYDFMLPNIQTNECLLDTVYILSFSYWLLSLHSEWNNLDKYFRKQIISWYLKP